MPTREEIVEELLEISVSCEDHLSTAKLRDAAAQVSAMRCETCKWYGDNQQCGRHNGYLFADDGCFHYEQKPAG